MIEDFINSSGYHAESRMQLGKALFAATRNVNRKTEPVRRESKRMGTQISGFSLVHCITIEQLDTICTDIGLAQLFLEINQVWSKNSSAKHSANAPALAQAKQYATDNEKKHKHTKKRFAVKNANDEQFVGNDSKNRVE